MLIDVTPETKKATEKEKYIMEACGETEWLCFMHHDNKTYQGITIFRTAKDFAYHARDTKVSDYMKRTEMSRIREIRHHRLNLKRWSMPEYREQWKQAAYSPYGNCPTYYFNRGFSEKYLRENKPFKLKLVRVI